MDTLKMINEELAIARQIDLDHLGQIADAGFLSIINLRSSDESSFCWDEADKVEALGLVHLHFPLIASSTDATTINQLLEEMQRLPKPVLIHCDNGLRSAAIALIYIATQHGTLLEQALKNAQQMGLFMTCQ